MNTITKKEFKDSLKYGKAYASVKKHVNALCKAIIYELDGTCTIKYIKKESLFAVKIYVSNWTNKSTFMTDDSLFMSAHSFASIHLNDNDLLWFIYDCPGQGHFEYRILHPKNRIR